VRAAVAAVAAVAAIAMAAIVATPARAQVEEPTSALPLSLVPWPKEIERDGAREHVAVGWLRASFDDPALAAVAGALNPLLRAAAEGSDRVPKELRHGEPTAVVLRLDPALAAEEYRLDTRDGITITGGSPRAVAWGGATLAQLFAGSVALGVADEAVAEPTTFLHGVAIHDAPDCSYRGLLVDVARQPHKIATLERLITLCWFAKVPYLQLHLTDDPAFTFPSRAFPELATKGHSFTREELAGLVAFAEARGVTIVPELEMPGHCGALIAAKPDLFRAHELHHATIAFAKPEVVAAMKTLVDELIELFPTSPWIHLGGDECDLAHVDKNPLFPAAYAREKVADAHGLYLWFLGEMDRHVKSRGRRTIVWEGFGHGAQPELSRDVIVMAYEALYHLPGCLLKDGYAVINTSWRPLYVVNDRKWEPAEIHAWNRFRWDHFVEGFPATGGLTVEPTDRVLGAQLCAWEQPDSLELPSIRRRLAAMSERTWNERAGKNAADFAARLETWDALLEHLVRN
jgi:hexosaminidase